MKRLVFLFFLTPLAISVLTLSANAEKGYKIALSNSFYGNTWRKQMVDVMDNGKADLNFTFKADSKPTD